MKKILLIALILSLCLCTSVLADDAALNITGDGVAAEVSLSLTELEAMEQTQIAYTTSNSYPTDKIVYAEGVLLADIIDLAGITDTATQIKFSSSDGYSKSFTVEELLNETRYTFVDDEKVEAGAMIALKTSEESFDAIESTDPLLMMGQRTEGEQTNSWFVKMVQDIDVQIAEVEACAVPTIDIESGAVAVGTELTVSHESIDSVKIYYTTDGTEPTYDSAVYNPSTTYYQPELTLPIVIEEEATIKLMAVGVGKANSEVVTYTYTISSEETVEGFIDMEGFEWASEAVATLAEYGIINGIGDNKYDPSGSLTRAAMSKVIVLLLDGEVSEYTGEFTDVSADDWFSGYVQAAVDMGIFNGMGDGTFAPNDTLTKEQMITVIIRALGYEDELEEFEESASLLGDISSWARGAIEFAYDLGIIEIGNIAIEADGTVSFDGTEIASRADVAVSVVLSGLID